MSFAHKPVRELMSKHFVCAWTNLEGDPDAGASNRHACTDIAIPLFRGIGQQNVQTVVLTPDGRVLHVMMGYVSPTDLVWELEQALATHDAVAAAPADEQRQVVLARQAVIEQETASRPRGGAGELERDYEKKESLRRSFDRMAERDRAFVRRHPLMRIEDLRTRDLTGGSGGRFGYGVKQPRYLPGNRRGLTPQEFERFPRVLRKRLERLVTADGSVYDVDVEKLPKRLRKQVERELKLQRKRTRG